MSDNLILCGDRLVTPPNLDPLWTPGVVIPFGEGSSFHPSRVPMRDEWRMDDSDFWDDEKAFDEKTECRVCHEEDFIAKMEAPCACKGTIKFAHRKCIQKWCNEKEDNICEICLEVYQPDYTVTPTSSQTNVPRSQETIITISTEGWTLPGVPHESHSPRLPGDNADRFMEAEFDQLEDEGNSCNDTSCHTVCRNIVLVVELILSCCNAVFLTILLLKEAYNPSSSDDKEQFYNICYIVLGFFVPCFVTAFALNSCESEKHEPRRELATTEIPIVIRAEEHNGEHRIQIGSDSGDCTCHLEA